MITNLYGVLLVLSVVIIIYMAQKNYENIDIHYWSIVVMLPLILLGYFLKTQVTTEEGAKLLFCYIYLDSTVLLVVFMFCILRFMRITPKRWVKIVAYSAAFAHLMMVWLCVHNNLYYSSMTLIDTGDGIATKMGSGPLKIYHWIFLAAIALCIVALMITALVRKGTYSRRTLWLYTFIVSIGVIIYGIESLINIDFSLLPFLYVLGDIMVAINYDHAHTHDISCLISEQQKYHGTKGYVAVDLEGAFLSSNDKVYEFLPELRNQIVDATLEEDSRLARIFYPLIRDYRNGLTNTRTFNSGDMVCQCEVSEFCIRKDGKPQGYLFDIRDVTEEQKVLKVMQDYSETLNSEIELKTEHIRDIQTRVVLGLANMVENRDNNTGGHVKRTSEVIKFVVAEIQRQGKYKLTEEQAADIIRAAPMHDLGKITIENSILLKPGRLTEEEYAIMKTHSEKSGEFVNIILKDVEEKHFTDVAFNVARYHHERWDGRGYPEGLVGEMIPLEARIMAVADVYDALVSKRCYKEAMSFDKAAQIMTEGMGTQFDPNMLSIFQGCRAQLEKYYSQE
jgi:HD-GYP domain-containing protein (c-di-GMP phosphodiesterase class II)